MAPILAAAALNQTPLDWDGNRERIAAAVAAARTAGVGVLCLPELCISGYGCEDAFLAPHVPETALEMLDDILPATEGIAVALGLPVRHDGVLYNAACLVANGRVLGFVAKQHLANEGIHYEPRWFRPWPAGRHAELEWRGQKLPLGDLFFDLGGLKLGFEICEDAWVADRPARRLAPRGVDVVLNPSASHFAFGKTHVRERLVQQAVESLGVAYVYSNLLGNEAGRAIYDGHLLIATGAASMSSGRRFSYADYALITSSIDMVRARQAPQDLPADSNVPGPLCVRAPLLLPEGTTRLGTQPDAWESGPWVKEEEFARSVALGLFDYLRKSRLHGFVVSLSGGVDSSAVACLAAMMVRWGVAELGVAGFKAKLSHIPRLAACDTIQEITRSLLMCVYQATRNSSATTRGAARGVAEAIGAEFVELDVDALVDSYTNLASRALGRALAWDSDDAALQNIQARVRSPSVWLLANVRSALLLATSNRSEAAVGYTTMDGDTSGGLSPIAGIDKAYLRRWLAWLETTGPADLGPIPALAAVNAQQPTAELRPLAARQTDEADLMPYDVLDVIERAAIRDKLSPLAVLERLQEAYANFPLRQLAEWTERFFVLWCRNQWKRERYAPSFHLDDENLDPKTWCRFPILSGGFKRELEAMRTYVAAQKD
ncbi:MAG: NAD(+) synthase [Pirellulales bacterium]